MGPIQLGVPNPACILKDWPLLIIDLKDCFFTILIAERYWGHFAFSLPAMNNSQPLQQFHWRVLPQGMLSSPTIYHHFVHQAIQPVRNLFPQSVIYHYMDDILIAAPSQDILTKTISFLKNSVASAGLVIAFKKKNPPFRVSEI